MRKVLILIALLPGLALADPVGGPTSNSGVQTASPQNNAAGLNYLQPAPNASEQSLSAPASNPANALQGSVPSTADQIQVEADGAPQNLPDEAAGNTIWIVLLAVLAAALMAAAAAVWQMWGKGRPQEPQPIEQPDTGQPADEADHEGGEDGEEE